MNNEKLTRIALVTLVASIVVQNGLFFYAKHLQKKIDADIAAGEKRIEETRVHPLGVIRHENGIPIIG